MICNLKWWKSHSKDSEVDWHDNQWRIKETENKPETAGFKLRDIFKDFRESQMLKPYLAVHGVDKEDERLFPFKNNYLFYILTEIPFPLLLIIHPLNLLSAPTSPAPSFYIQKMAGSSWISTNHSISSCSKTMCFGLC